MSPFEFVGVMHMTNDGGCLCGKTRYQLTASPKQTSICFCVDCRRASAAPMVAWASFPRKSLALLSGELTKIRHAGRLRLFASCCGTPLFFQDAEDAEWVDVTICSMDRPELQSPDVAIWTEDRLPWMTSAGPLPEFQRERETPAS